METQFFVKAGPDHGEESTRHLCPKNSFRIFSFCVFFLDSLPFPPVSSSGPYLSFFFNSTFFKYSHLLFLKKKTFLFFFAVNFFYERRKITFSYILLMIALVNLGDKNFCEVFNTNNSNTNVEKSKLHLKVFAVLYTGVHYQTVTPLVFERAQGRTTSEEIEQMAFSISASSTWQHILSWAFRWACWRDTSM